MSKPILVLGYGNPSRGDDALAPMLLDALAADAERLNVDLICDFQLQIEHTLDIQGRELVLFVDASVACTEPFGFTEIHPQKDNSYSTHAMSPTALLHVYFTVVETTLPPSFLLYIQGLHFELGAELSGPAATNLQLACQFAKRLLNMPDADRWRQRSAYLHACKTTSAVD